MPSHDLHTEITAIQLRLATASIEFDEAVKKDLPLGELKKIFQEMKILKEKLNQLLESGKTLNKNA